MPYALDDPAKVHYALHAHISSPMQHLLTHTYAARHIGIDMSMLIYIVTGVAAHVQCVLLHQMGPLSESSAACQRSSLLSAASCQEYKVRHWQAQKALLLGSRAMILCISQ